MTDGFGERVIRLKQKSEWIVALIILFDSAAVVFASFGERLSIFSEFFVTYQLYILAVLSSFSLIAIIALVVAFRTERASHRRLIQDHDHALISHSRAIAALEAAHASSFSPLKSENDAMKKFIEDFRKCSPAYRTLAKDNAMCDWELFHFLFIEIITTRSNFYIFVEKAITTIKANMKTILNVSSKVFTQHTGDTCASCVQLLDKIEGKTIDDAIIRTILRNGDSDTDRITSSGGTHRVRDNDLHRRIFIDRAQEVVENEFKEKALAGKIKTSTTNYLGVYHALLIFPVPNLATSVSTLMTHDADLDVPRATLCIDNLSGGFGSDVQIHVGKELAWRLSVMLYRLEALGGYVGGSVVPPSTSTSRLVDGGD